MSLILNLDGLVAPNHHYAGLGQGNLASQLHRGNLSSPKEAALQGLEKMWLLHQLGVPQGIIPPPLRPELSLLYAAGFSGSTAQVLEQAWQQAPELLSACYSASAMWAANSATCSASLDSKDQKLHFTPANLCSTLHRSLEAVHNLRFFQNCFAHKQYFTIHRPLPAQSWFADEGAANHIRLHSPGNANALNLFIYGREREQNLSRRYPARQTRLACESTICRHQLRSDYTALIQQSPEAIDSGAFHNDVVAVGQKNFLFLHEQAFQQQDKVLQALQAKTQDWQDKLCIFEVSQTHLTLAEAVATYLFNSQLIEKNDGTLLLLAPKESAENKKAYAICQALIAADNPVTEVQFIDLTQSMHNGGGPACLRLAVPITVDELAQVHTGVLLNHSLYDALKLWIKQHYRDQLALDDLRDPQLVSEVENALLELGQLIKLPQLYN